MRRSLGIFLLAVFVALGSGCAGKTTTTISPPEKYNVVDSRVFNKPYDTVWKAVVQSIGSSSSYLIILKKIREFYLYLSLPKRRGSILIVEQFTILEYSRCKSKI